MKKSNFLSILLVAITATISYSCSNNEDIENALKVLPSVEQKFNASKISTIEHNVMLENTYSLLKEKSLKVKGRLIVNEKDLDSCIYLFMDANQNVIPSVGTRSGNEKSYSFLYLKQTVVQNCAFNDSYIKTRTSNEEIKDPEYLIMFYNEFFKSDTLDMDSLNNEILKDINKVLYAYPNLTQEDIDGLVFVAGVTYNSCLYWDKNADKWIETLTGESINRTRSNWLWRGVKKWAKADGGGAISAWAASRIAAAASGGSILLAGAAVGSLVGAWDNLPCWD